MINEIAAFDRAIICWVFGLVSLCCAQLIFVPQIVHVIRSKNTSGSSLITYIINVFCWIFWCIWANGFYFNNLAKGTEGIPKPLFEAQFIPSIVSNTVSVILATTLLIIKVRHVLLAKKLKVTELQLSKILLDKQNAYFVKTNASKFRKNISWIMVIIGTIITGSIIAIIYSFTTYPAAQGVDEDWLWVLVVNFICGAFSEITSWPQFIKCIRKKDTTGISVMWAVFYAVTSIVFLIYDILLSFATGSWTPNAIFTIVCAGYIPIFGILFFKIKNLVSAKKRNMTEIEYTKKVLVPLVKQKEAAKSKKKI